MLTCTINALLRSLSVQIDLGDPLVLGVSAPLEAF